MYLQISDVVDNIVATVLIGVVMVTTLFRTLKLVK